MKKVLVFYKSKTGFTERYARWIAEEVGAEILPIEKVNLETLDSYDILVFGGPLFASRISALDKVQKWMEKHPKKTWVIFATGATPSDDSFVKSIERINFPPDTQKPARFYYFLSGINFEKMGWFNRTLIKLFARMSQKNVKTDSGTAPVPPRDLRSVDLCDPIYIEPLLKYLRIKR